MAEISERGPDVSSLVAEAEAFVEEGDGEEAMRILAKALSRAPADRAALRVKARCYTDCLSRPGDAAPILERLAKDETDPEIADVWFQLGRAYDELGRDREAVDAFDRSMAVAKEEDDSTLHLVLVNKASALKSIDLAEALRTAERAVAHVVDDGAGWYNKACYHALLGERDRAIRSLRVAIRLHHDFAGQACEDPDFAALAADADFREVVNRTTPAMPSARNDLRARWQSMTWQSATELSAALDRLLADWS